MSASTATPRPEPIDMQTRVDHLRAGRTSLPFALLGAGALLVLGCGAARWTGYAHAPAPTTPIATLMLNFADAPDGAVLVRNATTMRVMATERAADHFGAAQPFQLTAMAGNRLALTDTATGQILELEAFGPSNAAEFAKILTIAETNK
jgi:hypothetical protein